MVPASLVDFLFYVEGLSSCVMVYFPLPDFVCFPALFLCSPMCLLPGPCVLLYFYLDFSLDFPLPAFCCILEYEPFTKSIIQACFLFINLPVSLCVAFGSLSDRKSWGCREKKWDYDNSVAHISAWGQMTEATLPFDSTGHIWATSVLWHSCRSWLRPRGGSTRRAAVRFRGIPEFPVYFWQKRCSAAQGKSNQGGRQTEEQQRASGRFSK